MSDIGDQIEAGSCGPEWANQPELIIRGPLDEINRLRKFRDHHAAVIERLQFGLGIFQAAVTDEQRRRVARMCYETQGVCFCGCHGSNTGDAGEG